jgi:hypothetical protein
MANTYVWKINTLEREASDGFVFTAHYSVSAISDQLDPKSPKNSPYNSGAYGSIGLERPDTLVPFADLTESQVIEWVKIKLGGSDKVKEIESALDARILELITPSKINGLPWTD